MKAVHIYNQVYKVLIYCLRKENHIEWIKKYKKIVGIADNEEDLIKLINDLN